MNHLNLTTKSFLLIIGFWMLPMLCVAQFGADYSSYGFNFVDDINNDGFGGWEGTEIGNPQNLNIYRQNDTLHDYALELKALNQTVQIKYDDTGYMDLNSCSFIVNLSLNLTQYSGGQDRFSFKLQTGKKLVDLQFQNDGIFYSDDNNTSLITTAPIANEWLTYTISLDDCGDVGGLMIENDSTNIFPLNFPDDSSAQSIEMSIYSNGNTEFKAEIDHLFIYSNPVKFWLGPSVVYDDETNFEGTTGDRQHYLSLLNGERIGINENAGGYVTFTELFPGGPNLDPKPKFGSGGTKTLRGYFHSNEYNPVQPGIQSTNGGHLVTVNDLTTKLEIESFPLHNYSSGIAENKTLTFPSGDTMRYGGLSLTDIDIYDEFGLDLRHEIITELDFLSSLENVSENDGISVVRHQSEWEFVRHPCQVLQFHEHEAVERFDLNGSPHADSDMGKMRHKFEFRMNKDLGYEWVLWRENDEWQYMQLTEVGQNKTLNTTGEIGTLPFEDRFMVFSTSNSLTDPNAMAWYYPESDYNAGCTLQKSRTDKSIISEEDRRYRLQIVGDWRKTNWCRMNLYVFNEGLLAPNHGDPNEYESFRMEAYQLFGTPEEILDRVKDFPSSIESKIDNTKIDIYPNPSSGFVNVRLNGIVVKEMVVRDNSGKELTSKVQQVSNNGDTMILNFEGLPVGIYYLVLNDTIVEKFQKM